MAEFPDLPFFTDAYLADTGDLTDAEHAAYLVMIFTAWRRPDNAIPDDMDWLKRCLRAHISNMHGNKFNATVPKILARFWYKDEEGKYRQKKLEAIRQKKRKFVNDGRENAEKRWRNEEEMKEKRARNDRETTEKRDPKSLKNKGHFDGFPSGPSNASLPFPIENNNKHLPKSPREADRDKSVDNSESGEEGFFQNGFGKGMGREGIPDPSVAKPIGAQFHHSSFDIRRFLTEKVIEAARKKAPGWDIYALAAIYNEGIEKRGIPDKPGGAFIAWCGKYTKGNPP